MTVSGTPACRRVAAFAVVATALALLGGCASDEEKVADYLESAAAAREAGDHETEILELRNALQIQPTNAEVNLLIGDASMELGKVPNAAFYYSEAYRLDPTNDHAAMMYVSLIASDEPERAAEIIDATLERDPTHAVALIRRSGLELLEGRVEDALSTSLTLVRLHPDSEDAHRNLGTTYRAYIRQKLLADKEEAPDEVYEKALTAFQRASELHEQEKGAPLWYDLLERAKVYQHWPGHRDEAFAELRSAWDLARQEENPSGRLAIVENALYYARTNRDREIRLWALERQTEAQPDNAEGWVRLARFRAAESGEEGDEDTTSIDRSLEVWKSAFERNPEMAGFRARYASALHRAGDTKAAVALLDEAPPEMADEPAIRLARIQILLDQRRIEDAQAEIDSFALARPDDPAVEVARARLELTTRRPFEARDRMVALAGQTERVDLYVLLAEAETQIGDDAAALAAIDRAIELAETPQPSMYATRTRLRAETEDWSGVLRSVSQMRSLGIPVGFRSRASMVQALYELSRTDQARRDLEELVKTAPRLPAVASTFATYEGRRQPDRARRLLDEAIAAHPAAGQLILKRAQLELDLGHPDRALELLGDRLGEPGSESGRPAIRAARARIYIAKGQLDEAEADLRVAVEARPRPRGAAPLLARVLGSQGRIDEAIDLLERTRKTPPVSAGELWLLGTLYMQKGDLRNARDLFSETVRAAPQMSRARNDLAWVLAELNEDLDRALDLAREARADLSDNPAVADTLGWVYMKRDLPGAALVEFDAAIELSQAAEEPSADYHYHRGLALEELNRPREAAASYDRALALEPDHAAARSASARVSAMSQASQG